MGTKKLKVLIPQPKSRFILVRCPMCDHTQVVFSHATFRVICLVCGAELVKPQGGKAKILGQIVKVLG